jgi:hypothetical protein
MRRGKKEELAGEDTRILLARDLIYAKAFSLLR